MKIRRCPACAQLVHFQPARSTIQCWSCGSRCNFSRPSALDQALSLLPSLPPLSHSSGKARLALAAAAPIAALMLLLSGSFDIRVASDFSASFLGAALPPEVLHTGCFGP